MRVSNHIYFLSLTVHMDKNMLTHSQQERIVFSIIGRDPESMRKERAW